MRGSNWHKIRPPLDGDQLQQQRRSNPMLGFFLPSVSCLWTCLVTARCLPVCAWIVADSSDASRRVSRRVVSGHATADDPPGTPLTTDRPTDGRTAVYVIQMTRHLVAVVNHVFTSPPTDTRPGLKHKPSLLTRQDHTLLRQNPSRFSTAPVDHEVSVLLNLIKSSLFRNMAAAIYNDEVAVETVAIIYKF